jgi:hypothetical protein
MADSSDDLPLWRDQAEILRKKYRYRELILSGKLVLPHRRAAELLGPDCLYQLYGLREATQRRKKD